MKSTFYCLALLFGVLHNALADDNEDYTLCITKNSAGEQVDNRMWNNRDIWERAYYGHFRYKNRSIDLNAYYEGGPKIEYTCEYTSKNGEHIYQVVTLVPQPGASDRKSFFVDNETLTVECTN
jgi:hypothetical protein